MIDRADRRTLGGSQVESKDSLDHSKWATFFREICPVGQLFKTKFG